ncbi:capsid maturation protease [Bacillus phage PBS1]|uniref:Capsid maturation protease n=1 Tax=Bacillus phage PBS1 TaxID=2884423 RepID=A0A223LC72_BPPB1|nr:capsid maturation protease [Bacillus phage PBS1]AST99826.1 capsid maturation protease [Bacillus phage PBS1]BDE75354.1 hypothetical protein [Bacillus phage PBS1]
MVDTILLEKIYHRTELDQLDDCFEEILNLLPSKNFKDAGFKRNISKIEKLLKSTFNIDCKIFLHPTLSNKVSYGMRIFPSYEEMKGQYLEAIESKKKGYQLIDCHNVSIEIEGSLLNLFKREGATARMLTAILIHEIGHKVYVKVQNALRDEENSKNMANIGYGMGLAMAVLSMTVRMGKRTLSVPLTVMSPIIGFVGLVMIVMGTSSLMDFVANKYYSEREIYSDSLAVKYGYADEMYQTLSMLQNHTNSTHKISTNVFINWIRKNLNFYYLRRKGVIDVLKKEYQTAETELEKELIKKVLIDLNNKQNKDFGEDNTLLLKK